DVVAGEAHFAEAMLRPARRLIPVLPGDDVEPAVAVDVRDRGRLAGSGIDHLNPEGDIRRAALGEREQRDDRDEKQFTHEGDCPLNSPLNFHFPFPFLLHATDDTTPALGVDVDDSSCADDAGWQSVVALRMIVVSGGGASLRVRYFNGRTIGRVSLQGLMHRAVIALAVATLALFVVLNLALV